MSRSLLTKVIAATLFVSVALCGRVNAQAPTSYAMRIYNQGAAQPISAPTVIPAGSFVCGQAAVTVSGTVANPTKATFTDPSDATKACVFTDSGTGPLFALPFGGTVYEATLTVTNSAGTSPESARSNLFTRPGAVLPAPSGLKIAKLFGFGSTVFGHRRSPVWANKPIRPAAAHRVQ